MDKNFLSSSIVIQNGCRWSPVSPFHWNRVVHFTIRVFLMWLWTTKIEQEMNENGPYCYVRFLSALLTLVLSCIDTELLAHADMHIAHGQIVSKPSKHLVRYKENAFFVLILFVRSLTGLLHGMGHLYNQFIILINLFPWCLFSFVWCFTGGRYAAQYITKMRKGVNCGDCHLPLAGVSHYCIVVLVDWNNFLWFFYFFAVVYF